MKIEAGELMRDQEEGEEEDEQEERIMIMTSTRLRRMMRRISAHPSHVSWQRSRGGAV